MTPFIFFFPAKLIQAEHAFLLEPIPGTTLPLFWGTIGKQVYFSIEKQKVRVKDTDSETRQIFAKLGEHYTPLTNVRFVNVAEWLDRHFEHLTSKLPEWLALSQDPQGYKERALAKIQANRLEKDQRDKERERQKADELEKEEASYREALEKLKTGELVRWEVFERACKEHGVKMPIQTIGHGRSNVSSISLTGKAGRYDREVSQGVWLAARQLKAVFNPA